jgi:hypothetical protein
MKIKNIGDLKKYIADLPDSMEIKYYNGMVDDWHNVDVLETELIKEKPSFTLKLINAFNEREGKPLWDKLKKGSFKPRDWEFNEFIEEEGDEFDWKKEIDKVEAEEAERETDEKRNQGE